MKTLILCSAILAIVLTGCVPGTMLVVGSGRVATETRAVSNFDAVSLSGVGDLTITQGETEGLVATVDVLLAAGAVTAVPIFPPT